MGLFDLFKKKSSDKEDLTEQMLAMKPRQEPTKRETKPPVHTSTAPPAPAAKAAPELNLTPEPEVKLEHAERPSTSEPEATPSQLQTQSSDKKHLDQLPSVKKLVIPSIDESQSEEIKINTTPEEPKTLKQVSLGTKPPTQGSIVPQQQNVVVGEGINIPLNLFINHIPEQFMTPNAISSITAQETVRFSKEEILPILSQGVFAVVGGALLNRIPQKLLINPSADVQEIFNIPLDTILPLIPAEWFSLQGQDTSLTDAISGMDNPFADSLSTAPIEAEDINNALSPVESPKAAEEESVSVAIEEEENISVEIEEEESISLSIEGDDETVEVKIEEPKASSNSLFADDDEDIVEPLAKALPPSIKMSSTNTEAPVLEPLDEAETTVQNREDIFSETCTDNTLIIPSERVSHIIRSPQSTLSLPKAKALSCLAEGHFNFTREELCRYGNVTENAIMSNDTVINIGLDKIIDLIPPEWMMIQGQDTTQTEAVENMNNVFGSDFGKEPEEAKEQPEDKEPEQRDIKTASGSLITGGNFGSKKLIFDDDDEDNEEEIEVAIEEDIQVDIDEGNEEVKVSIEEEKPLAPPTLIPPQNKPEITPEPEIKPPSIFETQDVSPSLIPPVAAPKDKPESSIISKEDISTPNEAAENTQSTHTSIVNPIDKRPALQGNVPNATGDSTRPSTAPNGIDINRSNIKDLCQLHSAGEKLAQAIIDYRTENGPFKRINELRNVPGVGSSVYRALTGLKPSADLEAAERRINKLVDLEEGVDHTLGKIITAAQQKYNFKSLILSERDGFEICSTGDKSLLESNSELLAAATPQLFKKTKHFLKQANLPHPETFTFYLEETPVTFGIADEVFLVMVHNSPYPEMKHMKQCRELINELAWYCSFRAVL
ncbi:MAG: helix-hairpin-helix domain-containing protein [Lentisphaeraceae bacterium]|nr:helix-hairpin-helix domain-containing protein [Lentisphaeraceae bacterium]